MKLNLKKVIIIHLGIVKIASYRFHSRARIQIYLKMTIFLIRLQGYKYIIMIITKILMILINIKMVLSSKIIYFKVSIHSYL